LLIFILIGLTFSGLLVPAADLDFDGNNDVIFGMPQTKTTPAKSAAKQSPAAAQPCAPPQTPFLVSVGGNQHYRMTLPLVQFVPYEDDKALKNYCSLAHMPAGCFRAGAVGYNIKGRVVQLTFEVTEL
jgi:hypothetical protein